ncbi:TPA: recombination protein NinB [Stenotrophomonas maltophilia]|uniref:recombination protein NinB n=1 Tax=Stenotrophomonas maltophilia TaxID=40324 RepID=UPI002ACCF56D|nr:recombination protein NinB [Stenotrophomonas maltophilia]MDZ5777603.1 recombination protein NinB [Stenotrophomonas maltophilia]
MKRMFLIDPQNNRDWPQVISNVVSGINDWIKGGPVQITLDEPKRTLDQNAAMWPALTDIAKQVPLVITRRDGSTRQATAYDWKDVLTAAFEEETEWAPGLRGGVVMLGARTSKYSRRKMGDFLTFIHAEFSDRVRWSDSAVERLAQFAPTTKKQRKAA